jgi:hypothetical protein
VGEMSIVGGGDQETDIVVQLNSKIEAKLIEFGRGWLTMSMG